VLDLGVSEPRHGLVAPALDEAERVPHFADFGGVGALEDFRLGDARIQRRGAGRGLLLDGNEGGSARNQGRNDGKRDLHGDKRLGKKDELCSSQASFGARQVERSLQ
jgi:hypothetical protein